MKTIIELLVHESLTRQIPPVKHRSVNIPHMSGKASVLVGMRRTGKTFLCFQQMRKLLEDGTPRENMLYFNFEDDRITNIKVNDLQWITDRFYAANPALKNEKCWFFFDEIQCVDGWEMFIRRILDTENANIVLTGSSAKMLSREIGTAMRGRALTTEVFPLSFLEYCHFNNISVPARPIYGSHDRLLLAQASRSYLKTGGFPEVQQQDAEISRNVLQNYADVVILRDVIERHGLNNYRAAKALAMHILSNPGQLLSITKLAGAFSNAGIPCSKNTLSELLDYLEDAYFCHAITIHDRSLRRRQVNPRKVYAVDTGFCRAYSTEQTGDRGAALENAVFIALRGRGITPDYVVPKAGTEVDFVFKLDNDWHFIQCCWSMDSSNTAAREFRGLAEASPLHPKAKQTIVTFDDEGEKGDVFIVPLWRWLLDIN